MIYCEGHCDVGQHAMDLICSRDDIRRGEKVKVYGRSGQNLEEAEVVDVRKKCYAGEVAEENPSCIRYCVTSEGQWKGCFANNAREKTHVEGLGPVLGAVALPW